MVNRRVIIKFKDDVPQNLCLNMHKSIGAKVVHRISAINAHVVSIPSPKMKACMSRYQSSKYIQYVEKDNLLEAIDQAFLPSDSRYSEQWGLIKIKASVAWNNARKFPPSVPIAILDTGVDLNHADLSNRIIINRNFTSSPTSNDLFGHGTHVAGIASAITNNQRGVAGMNFNTGKILNVKVLGDDGSGFTSWVAQGIIFAANRGAKVINMSLGGPSPSETLLNAIRHARQRGAIVIAAAGNDGSNRKTYPAAYGPVISVAATDPSDRKATFSNFGNWVTLAAPGVDILSTCPNHTNVIGCNGYGYLSGTSMATPFVSGLATLIKATRPRLGSQRIIKIIKSTTDDVPGTGTLYQHGRINAPRAIRRAKQVIIIGTTRKNVTYTIQDQIEILNKLPRRPLTCLRLPTNRKRKQGQA